MRLAAVAATVPDTLVGTEKCEDGRRTEEAGSAATGFVSGDDVAETPADAETDAELQSSLRTSASR